MRPGACAAMQVTVQLASPDGPPRLPLPARLGPGLSDSDLSAQRPNLNPGPVPGQMQLIYSR